MMQALQGIIAIVVLSSIFSQPTFSRGPGEWEKFVDHIFDEQFFFKKKIKKKSKKNQNVFF
jgi:hypothetical protein